MTLTWTTAELEADMVNGKTLTATDWEAQMNVLAESVRGRVAELKAEITELESQIAALKQQVAELTSQVEGEASLRDRIERARTHVTAAAEVLTE